jgi:hypothetical protein
MIKFHTGANKVGTLAHMAMKEDELDVEQT